MVVVWIVVTGVVVGVTVVVDVVVVDVVVVGAGGVPVVGGHVGGVPVGGGVVVTHSGGWKVQVCSTANALIRHCQHVHPTRNVELVGRPERQICCAC